MLITKIVLHFLDYQIRQNSLRVCKKRDRKQSSLARKKLDKDLSEGKLWKKSRGHVELKRNLSSRFLCSSFIYPLFQGHQANI
ncbi:hypothetical protein LIER_18180 [Lithospermum erythrorhizon]|uniref:Uncharacterized protein n=1 Tax=Lithospermum erythrorhizon TaxID=34254 RepID=A0AAV3QFU4_LITER